MVIVDFFFSFEFFPSLTYGFIFSYFLLVVPTGIVFPMQNTMSVTPTPMDNISLSSPMIRMLDKKRKDIPTVDECKVAKKPRGRPPGSKNQVKGI